MKYMTNDNKIFDTTEEAQKHEAELEKAKEAKLKANEEKRKRRAEVEKAYDDFFELEKAYIRDYGELTLKRDEDYRGDSLMELFESIFG